MRSWLSRHVQRVASLVTRRPGDGALADRRLAADRAAAGSAGSHRRDHPHWPGSLEPTVPVANPAGGAREAMASPRSAAHAAGFAGSHRPETPPPGRSRPGATPYPPRSRGGAAAAVRTRAAVAQRPAVAQRAAPAHRRARDAATARAQPWYQVARPGQAGTGLRDCGCLERILVRDWAPGTEPSGAAVTAVSRLAELPQLIKEKLAGGLDAIYVGAGGVPDLDDMGELKGVPLPSGRATWDACAGAYGQRKIIVGSRPSPTPDVMCHEIGHALDDLDGQGEMWQSDSGEFCRLYQHCLPRMASEFHRQPGPLGRREFFADAFAAIASGQRPALVDMLAGDTRAALDVMLYFNVRYGI